MKEQWLVAHDNVVLTVVFFYFFGFVAEKRAVYSRNAVITAEEVKQVFSSGEWDHHGPAASFDRPTWRKWTKLDSTTLNQRLRCPQGIVFSTTSRIKPRTSWRWPCSELTECRTSAGRGEVEVRADGQCFPDVELFMWECPKCHNHHRVDAVYIHKSIY